MRSIRIVTHPVTLSPDCPSRDPPSAPVPCSPVILSPKITRGPTCMAGIPGRHPFRPPPRSPPPSRRATPFAGRWPPPWSSGSSSPAWHPAPASPVASSTRAPPVAARPAGCPLPPDQGSPVARRPAPLSRAAPLPSVPGSRVPHRVGLRRARPSRRRLGRACPPVPRRYRGLPRGPVAPRRLRYHCTPSVPTQPRFVGSAVPPPPWDSPTGTMPTLAPQHAPPFSTHATTHNSGIKSDSMRRPSRKLSPTLAECTRYILESLIRGHNLQILQPSRLFRPVGAVLTPCA